MEPTSSIIEQSDTSIIESVPVLDDIIDDQSKLERGSRGRYSHMDNIHKVKAYLPRSICQVSGFCHNEYHLEILHSGRELDELEFIRSGDNHRQPLKTMR